MMRSGPPTCGGTPPRVRGRLSLLLRSVARLRNTPACAGKTHGPICRGGLRWEHPRVCGEDPDPRIQEKCLAGTPPRVRGRLSFSRFLCAYPRNTPACAGKTRTSARRSPVRQEHPRVCGEDHLLQTHSSYVLGTPPRVRGRPPLRVKSGSIFGNTPACAGKTLIKLIKINFTREHPRVCGEDPSMRLQKSYTAGTPPRVRGRLSFSRFLCAYPRNTPACAGKTTYSCTPNSCLREHPRVCGEDRAFTTQSEFWPGTPPRVRGRLTFIADAATLYRNTPACAGKTPTTH